MTKEKKIGMSRSQVIYKLYQFITGPLFVSFDQLSGKSIFYYSLIFFLVLLEAAPNVSDGSPIFFEKCMKSVYERYQILLIEKIPAPVSFLYLLKI